MKMKPCCFSLCLQKKKKHIPETTIVASFVPLGGVDITNCVLFEMSNAPVITTCVSRVIVTAENERFKLEK